MENSRITNKNGKNKREFLFQRHIFLTYIEKSKKSPRIKYTDKRIPGFSDSI